MRWRVAVAVVLALAVGAGGGWVWAASQDDPATGARVEPITVSPVPATPSLPIAVAQPDPDDPTLEPGVELVERTLRSPAYGSPGYVVRLPVPVGWRVSDDGATRFYFQRPDGDDKSYGLRVDVLAAQDPTRSVTSAVDARLAGLESAELQKNLTDLEVDRSDNGFTATFTDGDGFRRVSIEKFYSGPDGDAFTTVAVYGRVRDLDGLRDLSAKITETLTTEVEG